MNLRVSAVLAAVSMSSMGWSTVAEGVQPAGEDPIAGTWEIVTTEVGGEKIPTIDGTRYVFHHGSYKLVSRGKTYESGAYKTDWGSSPAHLDITSNKQGSRRGIVEVLEDSLLWCQAVGPETPRPAGFRTAPNSGLLFNELRRVPTAIAKPGIGMALEGDPDRNASPLPVPGGFSLRWLDAPSGEPTQSVEINGRGDVLGERGAGPFKRPCLWRDSDYVALDALDTSGASANGLNDKGVIGATVLAQETQSKTYFWRDGRLEEIQYDIDSPLRMIYGLGAGGHVVGVSFHPMEVVSGWVWRDGKTRSLPPLGGWISEPRAVNRDGVIVGFASTHEQSPLHAALWRDGDPDDLGVLPGGRNSEASDLNDAGDVVGSSEISGGGRHAVLWRNGQAEDLGALPGGSRSEATTINSQGWVGGWSYNAEGYQHGVLWIEGRRLRLNELVPERDGWSLSIARAVNDQGQVAGTAKKGDRLRAFLLTPSDSPTILEQPLAELTDDERDSLRERIEKSVAGAWDAPVTSALAQELEYAKEMARELQLDVKKWLRDPPRGSGWLGGSAAGAATAQRYADGWRGEAEGVADRLQRRLLQVAWERLGRDDKRLAEREFSAFVAVVREEGRADDARRAMGHDRATTRLLAKRAAAPQEVVRSIEAKIAAAADSRAVEAIDARVAALAEHTDTIELLMRRAFVSAPPSMLATVPRPNDPWAARRLDSMAADAQGGRAVVQGLLDSRDDAIRQQAWRTFTEEERRWAGELGYVQSPGEAAAPALAAASPDAADGNPYPEGAAVEIEWNGRWWNGSVLAAEGPNAWKVHYEGYGGNWDETVGPDRIRPRQD